MNDASSGAGAAAVRGFLFSDVRGFTSFAERHGNAAAAAMVARFLDLARSAIAQHDGAEIKTEGDNIFAVFPSASSAVMCGLELVDAAAELNAKERGRPLELGVGVHAGEAVETAEGYIGSAVNMAARLCSAARAGEVLVSDTVKDMTQASIPVGFIARGRRRLKGFANAVETYAVTRDTTARTAVVLPRMGMLLGVGGSIAVALVVIAVLGATLGGGLLAKGQTPAPSLAPPTAVPVILGKVEIGTYATSQFQPAFTFTIENLGWSVNRDAADIFGLIRESDPAGSIVVARISEVLQSACISGPSEGETVPVPTDVIDEMRHRDFLVVSDPTTVKVGSLDGQQVDVTISEAALAACGGLVGQDASVFAIGTETFGGTPGERFRLITVPVSGATVTIIVSLDWIEAHAVSEIEHINQLGQSFFGSMEFASPAASDGPSPGA
ncbi:MAG TPA: adenylate/guanylate cyclase domain-containing protein [Candidatus Limnocylindrales bacterium]|nr:adenylate/guanylate cyclase domain-containing protein [Candidatus Limnocylindrales bacterium]